jgi:methionyl-tRNA formyltransferase
MRLVFAGSPAAAVPTLDALVRAGHDVAAVVTRADAQLGRRRVLTPTPVAARATELGIDVIKANRLNDTVTERVRTIEPELGVIVAYGGLVREPLLSLPRLGWVNLHFSLLPRWRGAAPVQHAILAGDDRTGACVFQLVPELDAGVVYGTLSRPIGPNATAGELLSDLAVDGAGLMTSVVSTLAAGSAHGTPQSGTVTFAPKLTLDDARLHWTEPADRVYARQRAMTPEPGAFTSIQDARLKVLAARRADDAEPLPPGELRAALGRVLIGTATTPLELVTVQPAGKKAMEAGAWWRGLRADAVTAR